jgi:hypothetical protein
LDGVVEIDKSHIKEYCEDNGLAARQVFEPKNETEEFEEHCGLACSGDDEDQVEFHPNDKELFAKLMKSNNGGNIARMNWPMLGKAISKYKTAKSFALSFPWLFPGGRGDFFDQNHLKPILFQEWAKNLMYYKDGRFQKDESWCFITLNMHYL